MGPVSRAVSMAALFSWANPVPWRSAGADGPAGGTYRSKACGAAKYSGGDDPGNQRCRPLPGWRARRIPPALPLPLACDYAAHGLAGAIRTGAHSEGARLWMVRLVSPCPHQNGRQEGRCNAAKMAKRYCDGPSPKVAGSPTPKNA